MEQKLNKKKHPSGYTNKSSESRSNRALSIGLAYALVALLSLGVSGAGLLYGQSEGDALFIHPNGNVGIGTTNPDNRLTITAAQQAQETNITQNVANNGLNIEADWVPENRLPGIVWSTNNNNPAKPKAGIWISEHNTGTRLYLGTSNNYAAGITNKAVTVKEDGNVGIGTDQPLTKLEISQNQSIKVGNAYLSSGGNYAHLATNEWFDGQKWLATAPGALIQITGQDTVFYTHDGKGAHTSHMIVKAAGNVGVGTATPADKLDIAGAVRMLTGSNPIRFTSGWSGFPDATTNQAEISNDTNTYKALMIVGNKSSGGNIRRVQVWDQLEVKGELFVTGRLAYYWGPDKQWKKIENRAGNWAGSYTTTAPVSSDLRFKRELQPIPSALDKIRSLRGVSYRWNADALQYFTRDIETTISAGPRATEKENLKLWQAERDKRYRELAKSNVGVVAQDVEAVLPEAVTTDEAGYKSVHYHYLIPLLIEAVKEQERTVNAQSQLVAKQQQEIERLTAANLAVRQQLADLAIVKTQVAWLEAALQQFATTQAGDTSGAAMARLPKTSSH